jgi:hypothetical protein
MSRVCDATLPGGQAGQTVLRLGPGEGELLHDLGAGAADAQPAGAFVLVGLGEDLRDARVLNEEFALKVGAVALAAAVEEDDVAGEAVGAAGFLCAVEDGLDGGEGLVIAEVATAAHDALLEEPGTVGGAFHFGVVVGFKGENVNAAEAFDEGIGDVSEVGSEADAVVVAGDEEAVGAGVIVGEFDRVEGDATKRFEGAGEAGDEVGEGGVAEVFGGTFGFGVAGFGGVEEVFHAVFSAEDADAALEDGLEPGGVEVVVIEVGEDDGGDVRDVDAEAGGFSGPPYRFAGGGAHALCGGAWAEAGINEEGSPRGADDGGVATAATAENA